MYYSVDFRKRVLVYEGDHRIVDTASIFGISVRVISSWKRRLKETHSLNPSPLNRKPRKLDHDKLKEYVEKHPDKYLREIGEEFHCAAETVRKALLKLKITLKKKRNCTKKGTRKNVRSIRKKYLTIEKKTSYTSTNLE
jgi:transposase